MSRIEEKRSCDGKDVRDEEEEEEGVDEEGNETWIDYGVGLRLVNVAKECVRDEKVKKECCDYVSSSRDRTEKKYASILWLIDASVAHL